MLLRISYPRTNCEAVYKQIDDYNAMLQLNAIENKLSPH